MVGHDCAGDVRLDKDERGYEHWGLIPYVSFRDGEDMQPLTGHRQSGGVSFRLCLPKRITQNRNADPTGTSVLHGYVSDGAFRDGSGAFLIGR